MAGGNYVRLTPATLGVKRHALTTATSTNTKTALLPAPFWCTERVDRTHFDWHWRERPALALLAWETGSDPLNRLCRVKAESIET